MESEWPFINYVCKFRKQLKKTISKKIGESFPQWHKKCKYVKLSTALGVSIGVLENASRLPPYHLYWLQLAENALSPARPQRKVWYCVKYDKWVNISIEPIIIIHIIHFIDTYLNWIGHDLDLHYGISQKIDLRSCCKNSPILFQHF